MIRLEDVDYVVNDFGSLVFILVIWYVGFEWSVWVNGFWGDMDSEVVCSFIGSIIVGFGGCRNDFVGGIFVRGEKIGVDVSFGVDWGGINFS